MYLALWDPAVLGALVGQADDTTLHVAGPILAQAQQATLFKLITHWWYWDREGNLHSMAPPLPDENNHAGALPFHLDEQQVDALVESAVPDQILQHIEQNLPELLDKIPEPADRYRFVREQLLRARNHGLVAMKDLVNYTSIAFSYGKSFDENTSMRSLLNDVKAGAITFDQALDNLEEGAFSET
jgi:hypothetical protein